MAQAPVQALIAQAAEPLSDGDVVLRLFDERDVPRLFEAARDPAEPESEASQRVAEKAGIRREGLPRRYIELKGRRTDGIMFGRLPADPNEARWSSA